MSRSMNEGFLKIKKIKLQGQIVLISLGLSGNALCMENIPATEDEDTQAIVQMIENQVTKGYREKGEAKRDAHAKAHGCVRGEFYVKPSLAPELKQGLLSQPRKYPAWIRFSNASGQSIEDKEKDGRGMAVKLMGVDGEKLLADEKLTQDFLMVNHPAFIVRNVADYVDFQTALQSGNLASFFFPSINPLNWRAHEAKIAFTIQNKKVNNLLTTEFFSMTPYMYGEKGAMKFKVKPCGTSSVVIGASTSPHTLRDALAYHLVREEGCFSFQVQLQTNPRTQPIEDPTIEWSEKHAPFVEVAQLRIPRQKFLTKAQQEFCEDLSFNPWHALVAHRPLGGINRVRKTVYQEISKLRHQLNRKQSIEPTGNEVFP